MYTLEKPISVELIHTFENTLHIHSKYLIILWNYIVYNFYVLHNNNYKL